MLKAKNKVSYKKKLVLKLDQFSLLNLLNLLNAYMFAISQ